MTTIEDVLTYIDGSKANGRLVVAWKPFTVGGVNAAGGELEWQIVEGVVSISLYSNANALPLGSYYVAKYELESGEVYLEQWMVPNLPTVNLGQVRVSFPPTPSVMISPLQLTSLGATPGMFLMWDGSRWVPGYPSTFNLDPNWIAILMDSQGNDVSVVGSPVSVGNSVTINIPSASATARGVVTTGAQSIAGPKTLLSTATVGISLQFVSQARIPAYAELLGSGAGVNSLLSFGGNFKVSRVSPTDRPYIQADKFIGGTFDMATAGVVPTAVMPGNLTSPVKAAAAIQLPVTGSVDWSGIGTDTAGAIWLRTGTLASAGFLYLDTAGNVTARELRMDPYQHPNSAVSEAVRNDATMVMYSSTTDWAGYGVNNIPEIWFRMGPNSGASYYRFGSGTATFPALTVGNVIVTGGLTLPPGVGIASTYAVNGSVIGSRTELNLIAGTHTTLTGLDNGGAGRVDITVEAAGGTDLNYSGDYVPGTYTDGDIVIASDGIAYMCVKATDTPPEPWTGTGIGIAGPQGPQGLPGTTLAIQDEGTPLAQRASLNFVGVGVTATDDVANNRTTVTITGGGAGSQTPWLSDINAAGFDLLSAGRIQTAGDVVSTASNGSAVLVREVNRAGDSGGLLAYAPRIAFFWGGIAAGQIGMENAGGVGALRTFTEDGTGYLPFIVSTLMAYGDVNIGPTLRAAVISVPQDGGSDSGAFVISTRSVNVLAERVRISAVGRFGIGVNNPAYKLEVAGDCNVTGGVYRVNGIAIAVFGASGSSHSTGLVPDPGATLGATRYLREDATWAVPAGAGGGLTDPTTTKGDLMVRGAAAVTRLGVSTDGFVLTLDAAQTLGVKWAAGGLIDPTTTKGDVVVRGAAAPATRLAVGATANMALVVDSAQALGVKWATMTAAMVTNAVDQTGAYVNPAWITSLPWSKITGAPATGVSSVFTRVGAVVAASGDYTAAQVTNAVSTLGSYADPVWITSLAYSKLTGAPTLFADPTTTKGDIIVRGAAAPATRLSVGASANMALVVDSAQTQGIKWATMTAAMVTNAADTTGSYANPSWITSLAWSKVTGAPSVSSYQTPWLGDIDGAGFILKNVGGMGVGITSPSVALEVQGPVNGVTGEGPLRVVGSGSTCNCVFDTVSPGGASRIIFKSGSIWQGGFFGTGGTLMFENGPGTLDVYIDNNGNFGINVPAPAYRLQVDINSAAKPTSNTWTVASSDVRTKRNVKDLEGGLEVIKQLRPIEAEYNGLARTPEGEHLLGFIAQEIREILPRTVGSRRGKLHPDDVEETDILNFDIHEVLIHLILAVKQLALKVS